MTAEELLIHELAERAGVSVRTIRYYVEEGLLPPPNYEGKYSYYKLNFLDRLELIRQLKDSYLPLSEIREIMGSLSDEDVRRRLRQHQPSPKFAAQPAAPQARTEAKADAKTEPGARALKYIDQVMNEQTKNRTKGSQEKPLQINEQVGYPLDSTRLNQAQRSPAPASEEVWTHIVLAPGVELHLRRPLDPNLESRVSQLIYYVRKVFHNKY